MFRTATGAVVTMGLLAVAAHATVIEIPLPGLLGTYPVDASIATRTTSFQLPQVPDVIHGAAFRLTGTAEVGSLVCEWGGPYPWHMEFGATMPLTLRGHWSAVQYPLPDPGSFTWTKTFVPSDGTSTWEFLMDGSGEISLYGAPTGVVGLCWEASAPPTGTVTDAVLIIDAEFALPVESSTWGRIKALYRSQ